MRADWKSLNLTGGKAAVVETTAEEQSDYKNGVWLNFWSIAEKEGGLMDRETGIRCSANYCDFAEDKGTLVGYDSASKIIKYLYFQSGVNEKLAKCRKKVLSADVDMSAEEVASVLQQREVEGLVEVPSSLKRDHQRIAAESLKGSMSAESAKGSMAPQVPEHAKAVPSDLNDGNGTASKASSLETVIQKVLLQKLGSASSSSSSDESNILLQTLLLSQLGKDTKADANGKEDPEKKEPKEPKPLKEKPEVEKKYSEATLLGKKLSGMVKHGESIVSQTKDDDNKWHWIQHETPPLEAAVSGLKSLEKSSQEQVVTSSLAVLQACHGADKTMVWLSQHVVDLQAGIATLEKPLSDLISLQSQKMKNLFTAKKKESKAKSKAKAKAKI